MSEEGKVAEQPHRKRFSFTDLVVLVVSECLAVPLCIAAGEAFVNGHYVDAGIGWLTGIPLAIIGASSYWWSKWFGDKTRDRIITQAIRWAPVAILCAFAYVVGPNIYRRAVEPVFPHASTDETANAIAPIIAERDAEKQRADDAMKELAAANQRLAALQGAKPPQQETEQAPNVQGVTTDPISWQPRFLMYSFVRQQDGTVRSADPTHIGILSLRASVSGSSPVAMKEAYIESELTGERRSFKLSARPGVLDAGPIPLDQLNPIPPGAQFALMVEWNPALSVSDFVNQWGRMRFRITYDDRVFEKTLNESQIKEIILQDISGSDLILESVREHQVGLQSFRSMRRMEARRRKASALRLRHSQSFASLRQRPSQASVRSTIQRLGKTTKPLT